MSAKTLEELVGRQLVFGLPGPDLTDADIRLFEDTKAGGIMLYRRNFETPELLERLLGRLESALGRRLLITTDHEGGRIIMLGRSVTIFPDNLTAGTAGEVAFVHRQGIIEGASCDDSASTSTSRRCWTCSPPATVPTAPCAR